MQVAGSDCFPNAYLAVWGVLTGTDNRRQGCCNDSESENEIPQRHLPAWFLLWLSET